MEQNFIEIPKPETACRLCGRMNTNRNGYTRRDEDGWECKASVWGSCLARQRRGRDQAGGDTPSRAMRGPAATSWCREVLSPAAKMGSVNASDVPSAVDVERHVEHLLTHAGVVGVPRWSGQSSAAVEMSADRLVGAGEPGVVNVRLVDYDLTVRTHAGYLAHLHECAAVSCTQVWQHALQRANRRQGPGPDFSLFWLERDGRAAAVLTHYEDFYAATGRPAALAWQVMVLTSWNIADWRMSQVRSQ